MTEDDLSSVCYNLKTRSSDRKLWVAVSLAVHMLSINPGIWLYGVETVDAGETVDSEKRQKRVSHDPVKIKGDVVQLVRTLPCHRNLQCVSLQSFEAHPALSSHRMSRRLAADYWRAKSIRYEATIPLH